MMTGAKKTREQLRYQTAWSALQVAKELGCIVEFQDRAAPDPNKFMKLFAVPGPETTRMSNDGSLDEEITEKSFDIPLQFGCECGNPACFYWKSNCYTGHKKVVLFPPETGVSVNAIVRFEGRDYSVKTPGCDSLRAKYKLMAEYHKPRGTSQI